MSEEVLYYQKDEKAGEIKIVKEDNGEAVGEILAASLQGEA